MWTNTTNYPNTNSYKTEAVAQCIVLFFALMFLSIPLNAQDLPPASQNGADSKPRKQRNPLNPLDINVPRPGFINGPSGAGGSGASRPGGSSALLPLPGFAKPPEPNTGPSENKKIKLKSRKERAIEMLEWELEIAQLGFGLNAAPNKLADYLSALHHLVELTCMYNLPRTLEHSGNPEDPTCQKYIKSLIELIPDNPIALCAQDGIDSATCLDAHQQLTTRTRLSEKKKEGSSSQGNFSQLFMNFGNPTTSDGTESINTKIYKLENELRQAANNAKKKRSILKKGRSTFSKFTLQECKQDHYLMVDPSETEIVKSGPQKKDPYYGILDPTPTHTPTPKRSAVLDESKAFRKPTPTPSIKSSVTGKVLIREISEECKNAIDRTLSWDPTIPRAVCNLYGNYSPKCIDALRLERKSYGSTTFTANDRKSPSRSKGKMFRKF